MSLKALSLLYVCLSVSISLYVSLYVCMYVCRYVCRYVCLYVSISLCVCLCMSVCMCVGMSVSMAGFLAAESLCQSNVTESVVGRAVWAAEQNQRQQANTAPNQPSHGKCCTRVVVTTQYLTYNECHMRSHSVTCHPTQVNTPRLNLSQRPVLDLLEFRCDTPMFV